MKVVPDFIVIILVFFPSDTIRFFQYQTCQALVYCWVALQWLDRDSDLQSCFKRIHSEPCWYYFRFNLNSNGIKERKKLDYSSSFAGAWLAEEGFCIRQYFGINSALAASQTRHHLSLWDLRCKIHQTAFNTFKLPISLIIKSRNKFSKEEYEYFFFFCDHHKLINPNLLLLITDSLRFLANATWWGTAWGDCLATQYSQQSGLCDPFML